MDYRSEIADPDVDFKEDTKISEKRQEKEEDVESSKKE